MSQDEDLKILGSVTASEQREQLDGAAQGEVGEFGQHQGRPPRVDRGLIVELQCGANQQLRGHVRLYAPFTRLRPTRGLKQDRSARVVLVGQGFIQNGRRGHHELAVEKPPNRRVADAFDELTMAM